MAKTTRLKMPVAQRAKQFAPFKAVTGLDEALEKVRRRMVQEEQHELSRDREEEINDVLGRVRPGCLVRIEYFRDGGYETLIDEVTGIREKQRIVKLTMYPGEPLKNHCELSNTVLTFEEQQAKLDSAAAAWENVSNKDGTIKGVYVHGVEADGIVGIETTINNSSSVKALQEGVSANTASISGVART